MISIKALNSSLSDEEVQASAILALACYSAGDASGFQEWYEPLLDAGKLSGLTIVYNSKPFLISGKTYADLADFPPVAVLYRGEWIGAENPADDCQFIIDETKSTPKVIPYSIRTESTNMFS